jgi:hypothetical protein
MRTCAPLVATALIGCKFGFENFLDLLLAWLTLFPLSLPFPQISHVPATVKSSIAYKLLKAGIRYHKTVIHAREKCWNQGGRLTFLRF